MGLESRFRATGVARAVLLAAMLIAGGCGGDSHSDGSRQADLGRDPGDGEADLQMLDPAMQPLRKDFEDAYGRTRLVAVLSSTCSDCLQSSRNLYQAGLKRLHDAGVEVFFVWGTVLPSDTRVKAKTLAEEMYWPGLHHYYDPSGRTTRAFGRTMGLGPNTNGYDIFFLYGPDATWDPDGKMDEEPADFNVASVLWAPSRPEHWWGDPERYPGMRRMWVGEVLEAAGLDTLAAE
ncbi:MAG: hypothetical protein R3E12_03395 [Candidatus Eisenbacteria bacterium]